MCERVRRCRGRRRRETRTIKRKEATVAVIAVAARTTTTKTRNAAGRRDVVGHGGAGRARSLERGAATSAEGCRGWPNGD